MMQKHLLVVGASILQLPAIKKAKEMGLRVAVADYNPQAIGIQCADTYYNVSTIDEKGIYHVAKDFAADGIMTMATDMPMRAIAYATEKLGLPGIDYATAVKATDKAEMIKAFEENRVEHPWFRVLNGPEDMRLIYDEIKFPCICKPVDNSGSRGVIVVRHRADLPSAYEYSRHSGRNGRVIVEEYLSGLEVSVEIVAVDGVIHVLAVTDKMTTGSPHFVEMGHSQPSSIAEARIVQIEDLATRAVNALGILSGAAHVEIMLTGAGPKMIELGARMGGDCITSHLVPLSTGIDMTEAVIRIALGESPEIVRKYKMGAAIRYFHAQAGMIQAVHGMDHARAAEGVKEIHLSKNPGDRVSEITSSVDRVGYVVAQGTNAQEAISICEYAKGKISIVMESEAL